MVLLAVRCVALVFLAAIVSACNVATAPVSVPAAFAHNDFLGLKGAITDQNGKPLDDVLVTAKRAYYLWHVNGSHDEYDTKAFLTSHDFDIPTRRASRLEFTFHKDGYRDVNVTVNPDGTIAGADRWYFPGNPPLHVILPENGYTLPVRGGVTTFNFTDRKPPYTLDLTRFFYNYSFAPPGDPPHNLTITVTKPPPVTSGQTRQIDPLDLNLPASITLHLDNPGDGLLPCTPKPTTDLHSEPAPAGPYPHELTVDATRLREMRALTRKNAPHATEFFYFHVAGRDGLALFHWEQYGPDTPEGQRFELEFSFTLFTEGHRTP
jgi:hypothetical protein